MSRNKGHNQTPRRDANTNGVRVNGRLNRLHGAGGGHAHSKSLHSMQHHRADSPDGDHNTPTGDEPHMPSGVGPATHNHPGLASALDCKVLVLNKLYMAVRVISARRAFTMLFRDLAEVVHVEDGVWMNYDFATWTELSELRRELEWEKHDWVSTVRFELAVPRVIRLLGYDRLPAQHVKLNRRNLFARDGNRCQYCGRSFPTQELSIDHVVPRTQGGGESWENLVCSCVKCNAKKGGRTPAQARMDLIKKPVRPKRNPLISMKLGQQRYESWKAFLDEAYWSVELR